MKWSETCIYLEEGKKRLIQFYTFTR